MPRYVALLRGVNVGRAKRVPMAQWRALLEALGTLASPPDRLHVGERAAYLWCADGILASKAAVALLGKAGREATTRNWATVLKIRDLFT